MSYDPTYYEPIDPREPFPDEPSPQDKEDALGEHNEHPGQHDNCPKCGELWRLCKCEDCPF